MNSSCIIEIDGVAAGVAVADREWHRFCAALPDLRELDGRRFPSPAHAARAVRAFLRRHGRKLSARAA